MSLASLIDKFPLALACGWCASICMTLEGVLLIELYLIRKCKLLSCRQLKRRFQVILKTIHSKVWIFFLKKNLCIHAPCIDAIDDFPYLAQKLASTEHWSLSFSSSSFRILALNSAKRTDSVFTSGATVRLEAEVTPAILVPWVRERRILCEMSCSLWLRFDWRRETCASRMSHAIIFDFNCSTIIWKHWLILRIMTLNHQVTDWSIDLWNDWSIKN